MAALDAAPPLLETEVRVGAGQLTTGGPQESSDSWIGHMRGDRLTPWRAAQAEDPRPPQLPSLHLRVEDSTDNGPRSGVLALHQEPGGQGAQPLAGGCHAYRPAGRGEGIQGAAGVGHHAEHQVLDRELPRERVERLRRLVEDDAAMNGAACNGLLAPLSQPVS
jgi:hypothetical protein